MKKTLPRFGNVDKYWIGADFGTSGWDCCGGMSGTREVSSGRVSGGREGCVMT